MRIQILALAGILALGAAPDARQALRRGAPESFTANAQVKGAAGAAAAVIQINIQRYTPDFDRKSVETALKSGGYPAFLTALRKAPDVGYVAVGEQKQTIRWAREKATDKGRSIAVVTDKPLAYIGGAAPDAKPRAGYEVAVVLFDVDEVGLGSGTMAAAARVKPGPDGGVQLDDYAEAPIKLVTVTRKQ